MLITTHKALLINQIYIISSIAHTYTGFYAKDLNQIVETYVVNYLVMSSLKQIEFSWTYMTTLLKI